MAFGEQLCVVQMCLMHTLRLLYRLQCMIAAYGRLGAFVMDGH